MCGIAGCFQPGRPTTPDDLAAVQRILTAEAHRGPDDSGVFQDERVVLGQRRLSIIDLSAAGHQPMANEDGTVWTTFNGEIYNFRELHAELAQSHQFHSACDTEVILHGYEQWGIDGLLKRAEGMFSFALYDQRRCCCYFVRDRLGIKPLYYYAAPDGAIWFASEVKSLLAGDTVPQDIDRGALAGFLLYGSVPWPQTTYSAVRCLPPGHYLVAGQGGQPPREVRFWDLNYQAVQSAALAKDELQHTLRDAVAKHLISDVSTGIFLSAGVDSSALVALARQARQNKLVTLTVGFPEQQWSEAGEAKEFARHFGTEHHEIIATSEDFRASLPAVLAAMDQPTNDGINTYVVSRLAAQAGLKVLLSGAGGDEVFWGYRHYKRLAKFERLVKSFYSLPSGFQNLLLEGAAQYGRFSGQERFMRFAHLGRSAEPDQAMYLLLRGFFAPEQAAALLGLSTEELAVVAQAHRLSSPHSEQGPLSPALRFHYLELKRYLHDQLLRDTDVFSMAHSIEVRVPLLDHRVLEQASRMPVEDKLDPTVNKPLLVRAVDDPELYAVSQRRKRGFSFPMREWMMRQADELEERAMQTKTLDRTVVASLWQQFRAGRLHWSRAWSLVVLGEKC